MRRKPDLNACRNMAQFDASAPVLRPLIQAAGEIGLAASLWRRGCRTFADAERALANPRFEPPQPVDVILDFGEAEPPVEGRLHRKGRG